jgi:hypothetical protein
MSEIWDILYDSVPLYGEFIIDNDYIEQVFAQKFEYMLILCIKHRNLNIDMSYISDAAKKQYLIEKIHEE